MTLENVVSGPTALAFLVNESRARLPEVSGDYIARLWARKPMDAAIAALWADFSKTVYPNDDIELSVRNRYFLQQAEDFFKTQQGVFINIAAGLTSYPYYIRQDIRFYELDFKKILDFKKDRSEHLIKSGELERRNIDYVEFEFTSQSIETIKKIISSNKLPKFILMEGISYYLDSSMWKEVIDSIRSIIQPCDILMIDFWHQKDRRKIVFDRLRQFLNRHNAFESKNFNFIDLAGGEMYRGYKILNVTDVFEQEERICLKRNLHEGSSFVLPERYASLVI